MKLLTKKLREDAYLPFRAKEQDCGYDLTTPVAFTVYPNRQIKIPLGIAIALPSNCAGLVWNRSGLSCGSISIEDSNTDQGLDTSAGLIDIGFRGELVIVLNNNSREVMSFKAGDRIAQLLIVPVALPEVIEVDFLDNTDRGEGGFGSTGKSILDVSKSNEEI